MSGPSATDRVSLNSPAIRALSRGRADRPARPRHPRMRAGGRTPWRKRWLTLWKRMWRTVGAWPGFTPAARSLVGVDRWLGRLTRGRVVALGMAPSLILT